MRTLSLAGVCALCLACASCAPRQTAAPSNPPPPEPAMGITAPSAESVVIGRDAWSYAGRPGQIITTRSYRIYTTETDALFLDRFPLFKQLALDRYRTTFGQPPLPDSPVPFETFLLATRNQWEILTKQLMGPQSEVYLRIPRGGFAASGKAVFYDIGPMDTFAIASHEGWHQYTQIVFREPLPIWLEEGIATYMEGFRWDSARPDLPSFRAWTNTERFDQLRTAAAEQELFPLAELLDSLPQDLLGKSTDGTLTYYAQVWALTLFLLEGPRGPEAGKYAPALSRLVRDGAAGGLHDRIAATLGMPAAQRAFATRRGNAAFVTYFAPTGDLARAQREYSDWLAAIVATGSRERIVEGRSPVR